VTLTLYSRLQKRYVRRVTSTPGLRERKNARTREAIERAALELALEQGFDHTTVDEIAARADVAPRTVYVRYPTKDAIVFGAPGASAASFAAWLASFEAWFDRAEGDLLDRLVAYVGVRTLEAGAGSELEQLRRRAILGDPYLRQAMRGRFDAFEQAIATRLATELGLPADDSGPRVFAAAVVGLLIAIAHEAIADPEGFDAAEDCERGLRFLRAGLEALQLDAGRESA
jgi:AcrR family transcriptional regulator